MKRELKNERVGRGRGRGRKDSFFFLPHPLPALLLGPFFARSLTRRLLSGGSPGGRVGGTPDNDKLFFQQWPNHAHEYNQSDSGLAFLLGK